MSQTRYGRAKEGVQLPAGTWDWDSTSLTPEMTVLDRTWKEAGTVSLKIWKEHPRKKGTILPRYGSLAKARIKMKDWERIVSQLDAFCDWVNAQDEKPKGPALDRAWRDACR